MELYYLSKKPEQLMDLEKSVDGYHLINTIKYQYDNKDNAESNFLLTEVEVHDPNLINDFLSVLPENSYISGYNYFDPNITLEKRRAREDNVFLLLDRDLILEIRLFQEWPLREDRPELHKYKLHSYLYRGKSDIIVRDCWKETLEEDKHWGVSLNEMNGGVSYFVFRTKTNYTKMKYRPLADYIEITSVDELISKLEKLYKLNTGRSRERSTTNK